MYGEQDLLWRAFAITGDPMAYLEYSANYTPSSNSANGIRSREVRQARHENR